MRIQSSPKIRALQVEGLEDRSVPASLGWGSLLQQPVTLLPILHDAAPQVAVAQSAISAVLLHDTLLTPVVPDLIVAANVEIPQFVVIVSTGSSPALHVTPIPSVVLQPWVLEVEWLVHSAPNSVAALPSASPAKVPTLPVSPVLQADADPQEPTLPGDPLARMIEHISVDRLTDMANTLPATPALSAVNIPLAPVPSDQPVGWVFSATTLKTNSEVPRVERSFVEFSPAHDEYGAPVRQDRSGHVFVSTTVYDELPVDSQVVQPLPQEADLLTAALPGETPSLESAVQQFLSQLDDVGREVSQAVTRRGGWLPLAAAASLTGAAAMEVAHRNAQRRSRHFGTRKRQQGILSWIPGLPGALSFEEA